MMLLLTIICIVLVVLLAASFLYLFKLATAVIRLEDALAESLDIIDKSYGEISSVLETPVMADSPEIKYIFLQLRQIADSVLHVSNVLAGSFGGIEDADEDEEEADK